MVGIEMLSGTIGEDMLGRLAGCCHGNWLVSAAGGE